jgi:hypothetical protein
MFSTNWDIAIREVYAARLGRLAFLKGEGEGEAWASASRFEQPCEVAFVGSKTPHLIPLPFCKGRGDKTPACGYLWHPLPREVA